MNPPPPNLTKLLAACLPGQNVKLRDDKVVQITAHGLKSEIYPIQTTIPDDPGSLIYHHPDGRCCISHPDWDIIDILPPFLHLPQ